MDPAATAVVGVSNARHDERYRSSNIQSIYGLVKHFTIYHSSTSMVVTGRQTNNEHGSTAGTAVWLA